MVLAEAPSYYHGNTYMLDVSDAGETGGAARGGRRRRGPRHAHSDDEASLTNAVSKLSVEEKRIAEDEAFEASTLRSNVEALRKSLPGGAARDIIINGL